LEECALCDTFSTVTGIINQKIIKNRKPKRNYFFKNEGLLPLFFNGHSQGISVVTCPGKVIEIAPPHVHMHVLVSFKAGMLPMGTVGEPGTHGAAVTGTHGAGVGTPKAADVAAITAGFEGAVHAPNVGMLTTGL